MFCWGGDLMIVINWLNTNQGFVMSILTLIYVIATIVIVYYNHKSIKELKETREAESRPYIFVYLDKDPRDSWFYLRVKNYGKSGAKIGYVSISPKLKLVHDALPEKFLKNVIVAPSQTLEFIILEDKDETLQNDYSVYLEYLSLEDEPKKYKEEYTLTIQYAHQMGYTDTKKNNYSNEANALNNIANYLDSLRRKI